MHPTLQAALNAWSTGIIAVGLIALSSWWAHRRALARRSHLLDGPTPSTLLTDPRQSVARSAAIGGEESEWDRMTRLARQGGDPDWINTVRATHDAEARQLRPIAP